MVKQREISLKEKDDIRILIKFVGIYCRENHHGERAPFSQRLFDVKEIEKQEISLCPDCTRLLNYGLTMRLKCPHDPKPMCKKCETQCYHGDYKVKIREVMKFFRKAYDSTWPLGHALPLSQMTERSGCRRRFKDG